MSTPLEELEQIRKQLGDLPDRLAQTLQNAGAGKQKAPAEPKPPDTLQAGIDVGHAAGGLVPEIGEVARLMQTAKDMAEGLEKLFKPTSPAAPQTPPKEAPDAVTSGTSAAAPQGKPAVTGLTQSGIEDLKAAIKELTTEIKGLRTSMDSRAEETKGGDSTAEETMEQPRQRKSMWEAGKTEPGKTAERPRPELKTMKLPLNPAQDVPGSKEIHKSKGLIVDTVLGVAEALGI